MRLDRGLFRDPATMTFPSRLPERSTLPDPERYLPQKVAEVTRDVIKGFPHTKRVGNYLLGKTLGEGSFAKVKESLHILTGERVAIKVIDKKKAKEDPYVRKNMRREGKLLQLVRHRHVIKLYEIMETENCYYLVTELCRGGDLMDHICARKRLEERETKRYIRAVISAVHYLHSAGILHRDLKIENLLLDENKEIKIIDFGLSNSVRVSPTKDGSSLPQELCVTQCGSPAYAAPELLGNRKYGPKVDVWSIGVNMYAMLTGTLPFTVEPFNIKQLHQKMLNGDMNPIPETLSKNGKDFLKKLLSPSPEERMSLAEAMQHPWVTDAKNTPMQPAPFPNKLNADDLDNNILKHMSENLDYRMSEAIRLVTNNIPSNATSTYHMFSRKLTRYNTEMRVQGKVAAAEAQLISSSRSTQNTSGYVSRDDGIDLAPMGGKDTTKSSDVTVGTRTTEDDSADETVNPVKTQARSSDVSPSRLLRQRHLLGTNNPRQRTFHGHETSQLSIKRTTDEQHTEPLIKLRPSTTKEQEGNHVELTKRLDTSAKLWAAPKTGKKSTFETKTTLHGEFQRKLSVGQSELPAIAEKPSSGHHERKRGKSHRSPHTIRRTSCDFKPMSNYSFRSRDSSRGVIRTGNYTFQPGGPFTDEYGFGTAKPTTQNNTDISVPKVCASAALPDANTDLIGKQNDSGKMVSQSVKVHPRKVLIDIAHYEKYSKNTHADSGKAGTTQSAMVSLLSENKRFGGTIYTTQAKINRPANRNVQLYSRNRSSIKNGDLNVTGERTGVNGSRVATNTRGTWSHDQNTLNKDENQNIYNAQIGHSKYSEQTELPIKVQCVQKERPVSIYQWKDKNRKP